MGMFDDIVCKYPLPLPDDTKGYTVQNFQTKDFYCVLDLYEIREDGSLWIKRNRTEHIEGNPNSKSFVDRIGDTKEICSWWEPVKTSNVIRMYDYQHSNEEPYDYFVEFDVVFLFGTVKNIRLVRFDCVDNVSRKKQHQKFLDQFGHHRKFHSTIFYKFIGKPYNSILKYLKKIIPHRG